MDQLNLSIPSQHDYTDPTVLRDVARLRKWLTDLPLMNVVETVRQVLGALEALNEQKLESDTRFSCLEVYRTTALRLLETVDPLYVRQLVLSRSQRRDTIEGVARLLRSMASGYKLIVMELQERGGSAQSSPLFGQVVNRAVEQLGYALLDCYRFYRTVPGYLITELHQLYLVARHEGLLDTNVPAKQSMPAYSTAMLYHSSMLLSLTDPERLVEGEVSLLFDVLQQHAGKCRIIQGNSWTGEGAGLFLLDLDSDRLPVSCAGLTPPAAAQAPFLLDANAVLDAVRERLAQTPEAVRQRSPEAIVLNRLLPAGSGVSLRREKRHSDGRWVNLLLGLERIHSYLARVSGKPPSSASPADVESAACRVLDFSESGMNIYWEEGGAGDACVGDLLGIVEGQDEKQSVRLASIRSLRLRQEGGMETGVQMIASGLGAVYCNVPDVPDQGEMAALFLPADEQQEVTATLVADKGLYAEGRTMVIDVGGKEIRVRAGRLLSDGPVFDRFEFSAE